MKKSTSVVFLSAISLLFCIILFFSLLHFGSYGWTLFLSLPFLIFLYAGYLTTCKESTFKAGRIILLWCISLISFSLLLFVLKFEGAICIAIATPILIFPSLIGFFIGYILKKSELGKKTYSFGILFLFIPLSSWFDQLNDDIIVSNVETTLLVDASKNKVWELINKEVVFKKDFDFIFDLGVTLPTKMELSSNRSVLSVETNNNNYLKIPAHVEDSLYRIVFNPGKENTPSPMKELSIYGTFDAPHLHDYFWIEEGFIELKSSSENKTIIIAKSTYHYKIGPKFYWKAISDKIIDMLHSHVLISIKQKVES